MVGDISFSYIFSKQVWEWDYKIVMIVIRYKAIYRQ